MVKLLLSYKAIPAIQNFAGRSSLKLVQDKVDDVRLQIQLNSMQLKQLSQDMVAARAIEGTEQKQQDIQDQMRDRL